MEYNTERTHMVLPEYGRNIQRMVEYAKTIEDRQERNRAVSTIVKIMAGLTPQMKDQPEFMHKVWDYVHMMADFELDVDGPYPAPEMAVIEGKPEKLPYSNQRIRYRYYGSNVVQMIRKATQMPEGQEREYFINSIASYMKMSYRIWNDEKVSDDIILNHLEELSDGKIKLDKLVELNKNYDTHLGKIHKKEFSRRSNRKKSGGKK